MGEAKREVPWTRRDFSFDPEDPFAHLGDLCSNGFHAAFADGSVDFISEQTEGPALCALVQRASGQAARREAVDGTTVFQLVSDQEAIQRALKRLRALAVQAEAGHYDGSRPELASSTATPGDSCCTSTGGPVFLPGRTREVPPGQLCALLFRVPPGLDNSIPLKRCSPPRSRPFFVATHGLAGIKNRHKGFWVMILY